MRQLSRKPLISVVIPVHDPEPIHLRRALESVDAQIYPNWEISIVDDASSNPAITTLLDQFTRRRNNVSYSRLPMSRHIAGATNVAIAQARGEFLAFLDHDDELTPNALLEIVAALDRDPYADAIYSDHDILGADGYLRAPSFKPDWCPELLLSYMYFGHLKVYRTSLVRELGGLRDGFPGAADYELALRLAERTQAIHHIPQILYHWRAAPRSIASSSEQKPEGFESGRQAVEQAARRRGIEAGADWPTFAQQAKIGVYRLAFRGTGEIPITIIVPTRDRLDLLRNCIDSIEDRTAHRAWRVLIVDNDSRDAGTLDYLARTPHRVVRFSNGGIFNFAAIVNRGVMETHTEHFVLLNNDTTVISPEWLDELLGYGMMPGVGAVGAKLLYPDMRIQHAGVVLGTQGLAGHAFQARQDSAVPLEYQTYAHVARNYLAVTAACMLSHQTAFNAVGGFNERDLKVAWNDVDYCLRLRDAGYRVVFNPYAILHHFESQSRGDDKDETEIGYMMKRWPHYIDYDPFYGPHLSRSDADFRIKTEADEGANFFYRNYRR
jgi:GT2 family glycosyltransferase